MTSARRSRMLAMIILFIFQFQIATNLIKNSGQFFPGAEKTVCANAITVRWRSIDFTFVVCHSHVGISQFALVHAVVHVHVRCACRENFRSNFLYQSLLALLVDVVNFRRALELK